MLKITAVVITKNEEVRIENCLKSLDFADEILIIDDSADKTCEIAKKNSKVKAFKRTFDNYSGQRNFGIEKASNDWILMFDADEETESTFALSIDQAIEKNGFDAFKFPRKNIIFGKWIKHAGWYPDFQTRLFKKGKAHYERLVHEKLEVDGEIGELTTHIIHHNYDTITQYLDKLQKYTTLEQEELLGTGYKFHWPDLILKSNGEFLRRFFAEFGYKDGLHGLVLSILQGFYTLVVYLKVWEKEKFREEEDVLKETEKTLNNVSKEWKYWFLKTLPHSLLQKIKSKI